MTYQREIHLQTSGHRQMHDLTDEVARIVSESKVRSGLAQIFNVGSTGGIGSIELERGLAHDIGAILDKFVPPDGEYAHQQTAKDANAHSHLQATLLGLSLTVPVAEGRPILGTWQQIFFLECDVRPRRRTIIVTVHGE